VPAPASPIATVAVEPSAPVSAVGEASAVATVEADETESDDAELADAAELAEPVEAAETRTVPPSSAARAVAVEPARESGKKKRARRKQKKRAARLARQMVAVGTPAGDDATWSPKMPPFATSSVPWRRPASVVPGTSAPSLVIDDADPDSAERVLEERAERREPRRSFLPPILLDREDRSSRQGGLTLAVILLLIAATLTLSYLMRRPSASGDGMTWRDAPASAIADRAPAQG